MNWPLPIPSIPDAPRVSVLMAVWNGQTYVRDSIASLLAQTFRDFELIVVDDCSTDGTAAILAGIADPRLTVLRNPANLGVVASRNRGVAVARGTYVALHDHDDLSRPTRLARQVAYLDSHPGIVLVATAAHILNAGQVRPPRPPLITSPALVAWMLQIANPLVCSSVMLRLDAVRQLDVFMRPDYIYAEDYDLYHRLMPLGGLARLDEPLTLYRQHETMMSRKHEAGMMAAAERVLASHYDQVFGADAAAAAHMIVRYVTAMHPVPDLETLRLLQTRLRTLTTRFLAGAPLPEQDRALVLNEAEEIWARVVRFARRKRVVVGPAETTLMPGSVPAETSAVRDRALATLSAVPYARTVGRWAVDRLGPRKTPATPVPGTMDGRRLAPVPFSAAQPPTLFVVVDTEAEFDWSRPMDRAHAGVGAIQHVGRGQAVFDRYGLRPVYVVDYPVTTNPDSVATLRAILDRGGCEIGAHLHPWTTPPFAEPLSDYNSYPGNLPRELERDKLVNLVAAIKDSFGIEPVFYKAGRYGFGPNTASILHELGIRVDFSLLPGADLRRRDGPDFRGVRPVSYWLNDAGPVAVPMTRSTVGLVPPLGRTADWLDRAGLGRSLPWRPFLARLRLADTITLTPEGVTTTEQIRLIRTLLRRGQRQFILHYHSPSLAAGNTSYTPDEAAVERMVTSLRDVCAFFFDQVGGLPGYPRDLLPPRTVGYGAEAGAGAGAGAGDAAAASASATRSATPGPLS